MTGPNDPAFPPHYDVPPLGGLTKREYFAAMAMQGIIACPESVGIVPVFAADAVKYADALIAELNKEKP